MLRCYFVSINIFWYMYMYIYIYIYIINRLPHSALSSVAPEPVPLGVSAWGYTWTMCESNQRYRKITAVIFSTWGQTCLCVCVCARQCHCFMYDTGIRGIVPHTQKPQAGQTQLLPSQTVVQPSHQPLPLARATSMASAEPEENAACLIWCSSHCTCAERGPVDVTQQRVRIQWFQC